MTEGLVTCIYILAYVWEGNKTCEWQALENNTEKYCNETKLCCCRSRCFCNYKIPFEIKNKMLE